MYRIYISLTIFTKVLPNIPKWYLIKQNLHLYLINNQSLKFEITTTADFHIRTTLEIRFFL